MPSRPSRFLALLILCVLVGLCLEARAGGGPENVLLVVNPRSVASMTIANHYVALRDVPPGNVLYLPWDPKQQTIDVDSFRRRILGPVLDTIRLRRLARQIDYVVYSSDFPWVVDLTADVRRAAARGAEDDAAGAEGDSPIFAAAKGTVPFSRRNRAFVRATPPAPRKSGQSPREYLVSERQLLPAAKTGTVASERRWPKHLSPTGSLNGLTYLWRMVAAGTPDYVALRSNQYMRRALQQQKDLPTLGFSSRLRFGPHGELVSSGGQRYLLSVVLGVTAGRGNSVDEVLAYLRRSAAADGSHPRGTIYFMQNGNVRSRVRDRAFPLVVRRLAELGVDGRIIQGMVPRDKPDVQGAMLGAARFDWAASGSTILPGAICKHLTSFGGVMRKGAPQTPLAEFLRHGAAGSSGTVAEPYAIQEKFPAAMMHVHYARGCTMAEAFYQSVYGPYQLLIVGDPLCRPWANVPRVEVKGVTAGAEVKSELILLPSAEVAGGQGVERFELFVDGLLVAGCKCGKSMELDTTRLPDGHHRLRIVAIESGPIGSRGRLIVPIRTSNHGRAISASCSASGEVPLGRPVEVRIDSPGSAAVGLLHNGRLLRKSAGASARLTVDTTRLGPGPISLLPVGLGSKPPLGNVLGRRLELVVRAD